MTAAPSTAFRIVDVPETYGPLTDGRRSIAMAIMAHGHAVGALNMTWPGHRMPVKEVIAQHLATLRRAAAAIGREVEGTPERPSPAHLPEPLAVPAGPGVPANP